MKPTKKWGGIFAKEPLTKERIQLACLEETIKQLPRIQYRMKEITGKIDNPPSATTLEFCIRSYNDEYSILAGEYDQAMKAKEEFADRTNRQWADYIHNQATLEFYSELHKK